jgi:steroid 5-alpha reductase family enzyme
MILLNLFLISLGLQFLFFIPAFLLRTDKFTDFTYSLTFILLGLISLKSGEIVFEKLVLFLMIFVWAVRLGGYLFIRINKIKRDVRFDEIRGDLVKFMGFWILQGVSVFVILLPTFFFFQKEVVPSTLQTFGLLVWFMGFMAESVSDWQKFRFTADERNRGKWIDRGLWKYSRHPNYLGEILCWLGVYIYVFSSLDLFAKLLGLASPVLIISLLLFVTGIPKLEENAQKKWGDDPKYREYKKKTKLLIPFLF